MSPAQKEFFRRGRILQLAKETWKETTLEKTIVKTLRQGLAACGIPVFTIHEPRPCHKCQVWPSPPNEAGLADLWGYVPALKIQVYTGFAVPLYIEVKRPKGGVEAAAQKDFIERARTGGAIAFFAKGWDECVKELRAGGVILPKGV